MTVTRCFTRFLNLVVKKSLNLTPELEQILTRARRIVQLFKSSTKDIQYNEDIRAWNVKSSTKKLAEIQVQMGRPHLKLIQEVETRWKPARACGRSFGQPSDRRRSTHQRNMTRSDTLLVLRPFHQAHTVELSEEKSVGIDGYSFGENVEPPYCQTFLYHKEIALKLANNALTTLTDKFALIDLSYCGNPCGLLSRIYWVLGADSWTI